MKNEKTEGTPFPLENPQSQILICPHCEKPIERIEWRNYGENKVGLVGCSNCKKVLGANVIPTL